MANFRKAVVASAESKGTMGSWQAKKSNKRTSGSQTSGILKGKGCVADMMQRYMAKSSRSYKDPKYGDWCRKMDKMNGQKR